MLQPSLQVTVLRGALSGSDAPCMPSLSDTIGSSDHLISAVLPSYYRHIVVRTIPNVVELAAQERSAKP